MVHRKSFGLARAYRNDAAIFPRRTPAAFTRQPEAASPRAFADAGRNGVSFSAWNPRPFALPQGPSVRGSRERANQSRRLRACRINHGNFWRQFQLARTGLVPRQLPYRRIAAEISSLLWRGLPHRVPHAFAQRNGFVGSGRGPLPPPDSSLLAWAGWTSPRGRRHRSVSE